MKKPLRKKITKKTVKKSARKPKKTIVKKKIARKKSVKSVPKKKTKKILKKAKAKKTIKKVPKKKTKATKPLRKKKIGKKPSRRLPKPAKRPKKTAKKKVVKKTVKIQRKTPKILPVLMRPKPESAPKKKITFPVVEWAESDRIKMLTTLLKELRKKKVISDWRINLSHARTANLYVGNAFKIENQLTAIREDILVTACKRFPDGTIGEVQIPIITGDEKLARHQLMDAATVCEHARKPAYDLPAPEEAEFPKGHSEQMLSAFQQGEGMRIPLAIHSQVKGILSLIDGVKTNCYEIFTTAGAVRVLNSNGVDISYHKTSVYLEITLSAKSKEDEQEFQWRTSVVSPEQLDLHTALEQQAEFARDALRTEPNPGFTGDILLSGQSLLDFFAPNENYNPLILHTFAKLKLMGLSQLTRGAPLGEFGGEPFTISSDPSLPLGLLTGPVDEEGVPWKPVDLIRTGIFANHIATPKYAQRMELPLTGAMSNVHIGNGATREEHLRGNNYYEIVNFSWFNPDSFSGDFSAEIRLGYHWLNGKKTPFKGGNLTGNVFSNLLNARFSREITQEGRYYGPRAILFKDGRITKRE